MIKISDAVYTFSEVMAQIDLRKYLVTKESKMGRKEFDREKLLKIVLFAFMEHGYCSVRQIQKLCETDIRFLWILDEENAPSFMTIHNFIHHELENSEFEVRQEYSIEYVKTIMDTFLKAVGLKMEDFVHGSGKRKTQEQKLYEKLEEYYKKLKKYGKHIAICGEKRNSCCKTDHDATFMRLKRDYMGNDQLLPAYHVQLAVCHGYIAHFGAYRFASGMDCFKPMMESFSKRYGFYPKYPIADAGYGSYNNYLYCQENAMEKFMKFTMYEKESKDKKYQSNPYRVQNFPLDEDGNMVCPNGKRFFFLRTAPVKGNQFGRTEEYFQCENCEGCSHRQQCHKAKGNRVVRINQELTALHQEVLANLNCIHGALLRMNRSVQSESTFGTVKWNRGYTRLRRRGLNGVLLELGLISCGFNLHKLHLNRQKQAQAA